MPFARPTLSELRIQTATDINAGLPGVDALLRHSNLGIIADMVAGGLSGLYGYLDWLALNQVPFTATGEYLEGWAALKGVTRKPAARAAGAAVFTGTNGRVIPAGSPVTRSDGFNYTTTADGTVASGTVSVPIQAIDAGAGGNSADGATMLLEVGISGISGTGAADGPVTGGADVEPDDQLRNRMIKAYSRPPQGGSEADYEEWALAVPGVTRCWVKPSAMGPGTIVLLFMMDDAESAFGGFPQGTDGCATNETRDTAATGDQLALADAIFSKQPVTALVYAVAPSANTIGLTLAGISGASTAVKAAIAAAFSDALRYGATPGGVTDVSSIEAAIAAVNGSAGFVITNITASAGTISPGSAGNITSNAGALPVPGAIAYV